MRGTAVGAGQPNLLFSISPNKKAKRKGTEKHNPTFGPGRGTKMTRGWFGLKPARPPCCSQVQDLCQHALPSPSPVADRLAAGALKTVMTVKAEMTD